MIYLFTWNSPYLIREKTLTWKNLFIEKNGEFNLVHFKDIVQIDNNHITETLTASGFMWEKKLIIIDDFPLSADKKTTQAQSKQDFLENVITHIPESNIVIFSSCSPDKRGKFYKKIKKIATKVEEYNTSWEQDIIAKVHNIYPNTISPDGLNLLIRYKSSHLEKVLSEIEKLAITKEQISIDDIKRHVSMELEESIFELINLITQKNIPWAISAFKILSSTTNIYALYNNLIANLRTSVYISRMKHLKVPIPQITSLLNLWNRGFLVTKSSKINHSELQSLYITLVSLDKKMKSWKLLWTEEKDFQFEIEKALLQI